MRTCFALHRGWALMFPPGEGKGTVTEVSLLTGLVKVRMDKASDGAPMIFEREAVKVIRDARPQREDIDFKTNKELKKLENQ